MTTQRSAAPTDDRHRPRYHFQPPSNWMNDPNGFSQWGASYHLFYQYNPNGAFHGSIHWGHAVSEDLVHWRHLPIALAPTPNGPDEGGCWSGCAVDNDGVATLVYTGDRDDTQRPCIATSRDGLLTWEKYPGNPIIRETPPGLELEGFRDHSIWRDAGQWHQLIGAGIRGQGGTALLYRSDDMYTWEYLHPLLVGDRTRTEPIWTGEMWECPDFFALDGQHAMTISVWAKSTLYGTAALVGTYQDLHFTPHLEHKLDYGDRYFYAAQTLRDSQGRRIIIAWVQEGRSDEAQRAAGWAGLMSLPRVLSLGPDGQLCANPVPEVAALRGTQTQLAAQDVPAGETLLVPHVAGDALELEVTLQPAERGNCGVVVRRSPDGTEQTRIVYDAARTELRVERDRSSQDDTTEHSAHVAPLTLAADEPLQLRIFVDCSVLEVFANQRVCITSRIYPTRDDSTGVALVAEQQSARLVSLRAWQMQPIAELA